MGLYKTEIVNLASRFILVGEGMDRRVNKQISNE